MEIFQEAIFEKRSELETSTFHFSQFKVIIFIYLKYFHSKKLYFNRIYKPLAQTSECLLKVFFIKMI